MLSLGKIAAPLGILVPTLQPHILRLANYGRKSSIVSHLLDVPLTAGVAPRDTR